MQRKCLYMVDQRILAAFPDPCTGTRRCRFLHSKQRSSAGLKPRHYGMILATIVSLGHRKPRTGFHSGNQTPMPTVLSRRSMQWTSRYSFCRWRSSKEVRSALPSSPAVRTPIAISRHSRARQQFGRNELATLFDDLHKARPDIDLVSLSRQLDELDGAKNPLLQLPSRENANVSLAITLDRNFDTVLGRNNAKRKKKKHRQNTRRFEEAGGYRIVTATTAVRNRSDAVQLLRLESGSTGQGRNQEHL